MDVVILAGGRGTRMGTLTRSTPKPMLTVGGLPILEHLVRWYASFGHRRFLIAGGYRFEDIQRWADSLSDNAPSRNRLDAHDGLTGSDLSVEVIDTGLNTPTGGRLRECILRSQGGDVLATYGDGLSDVELDKLLDFHKTHGRLATVTAVRPPARFGRLELHGDTVASFGEKVQDLEGWINGGFFVLSADVVDYLREDVPFEHGPLERLAEEGQLMAYRHSGFWQPMDTERDREVLEDIWASDEAPWRPLSRMTGARASGDGEAHEM